MISLILQLEITIPFSAILHCFICFVFCDCPYHSLICIMCTCWRVHQLSSPTQRYLLNSNFSTVSFGNSPPLLHAISVGLPITMPDFLHHRIGYKVQAWPIRPHHYLSHGDWLTDEVTILEWPIRALPWNFFVYRYSEIVFLSPWSVNCRNLTAKLIRLCPLTYGRV